MHVLVTGGAGFVGSHLVDSLLRDGHRVTTLDNFDPLYDRALKEKNIESHRRSPLWQLAECDLRDRAALAERLTGTYDAIVHLAAKTGVRPSVLDPIGYQEVNVRGTHNVLEFARERNVRHFVFASSSSVYGLNPRVPWSEEDHELRPISLYASTKVSGELLGHVYSHLHGMRVTVLRFFTVYGPRQRPDLAIHKFARLMLAGEEIPVFGDGSTRRDYTYVGDIVQGVRAAIEYEHAAYDVINLGNNHTISLLEMIHVLEEVLGVRARMKWLPEQAGDVPQTWASVERAQKELGYRPGTPFGDGVRKFVEWLRHQAV